MGNNESKITKSTAVMMVCVAIFIDLIQFLLNFIPFVGWIIIWMINVITWLTFYIWLRIKGVSFSNTKKSISLTGAFVMEFIPIIDVLPAWSFAVIRIISLTWMEERGVKAAPKIDTNTTSTLKKVEKLPKV